MYKDILVDTNNIYSNLTTLQNDADDNDKHQQATSNNVTTDGDPAFEFDRPTSFSCAREREEQTLYM